MRRARGFPFVVIAAAIAGLAVLAWLVLAPGPLGFAGGHAVALSDYPGPPPTGVPPALSGASLAARGEYLTRAADCAACHTAKGGKPFAGGLAFKLPFGTLYTPNITPDPQTGIGLWTPAEFLRAVHEGVGRGGKPLYPAFPYTSYTLLTDQDVLAIRAYLFTLKPIYAPVRPDTLKFPYNQRALMIIWAHLFDANRRFSPIKERSAQWNRGAYLVEAAEHCGECHTPRNVMQAMDTRRKFAGGAAEGWTAYNITQDRATGIGAWSPEVIARFLSSGHAAGRGSAGGPMAEAIDLSLSHLTPDDLAAISSYLKTVPAIHSTSLPRAPARPAPDAANLGDEGEGAGKRIFEGACASCHAWGGSGVIFLQATLTGSRAVNDAAATNVAQMVLNGTGPTNGGRPFMPSFSAAYSDAEVAAVANYVTRRFGEAPSHLTPRQVHGLRAMN